MLSNCECSVRFLRRWRWKVIAKRCASSLICCNKRKLEGKILSAGDERMVFFKVNVREKGNYFTDPVHDLKERLLLKKYNNLPVNWQIEIKEKE